MNTCLFIWIIGFLFTLGFFGLKGKPGRDGLLIVLLCLFLWPFSPGVIFREALKTKC